MEMYLYLGAIIIMMWAQLSVQGAYKKYRAIPAMCSYSGEEVALLILKDNNCSNVRVEVSNGGTLSDHFDPTNNIVRLSQENFNGKSIAAIAVAAHECGHAIQHATGYSAIDIRNKILPFANVASQLGWVSIFIGLLLSSNNAFLSLGIIMLGVIALFQVVTLPIEFDASSRALKLLSNGILDEEEVSDAKKMLSAAAFTYVAALVSTIFNILRIILISNNRRRD